MISSWLIIFCSLIYIALLFAIAYFFEQRKTSAKHNTWIYSLSLAIFCTSWAFFGTIAQAASTGWYFAPTYIGALILLFFGWRFLSKLVSVGRQNNITSIADFISSRFGKSQLLAATITLIAFIALVPYIALQLKALTISYALLTTTGQNPIDAPSGILQDAALYISLLMGLFAIVFGTRRVDAAEHQTGIIHAVAFESVVKLIAFLALGIYICFYIFNGVGDLLEQAAQVQSIESAWQQNYSPLLYWVHALLGLLAIFCLPRQFHVLVVENKAKADVRRARWIFGSYLLLINLFILPIAIAGLIYFNQLNVAPDTFILAFPLSEGSALFSLIAYLGGFSAATSMIIIVSVVLSTMISNDILLPLAMSIQKINRRPKQNIQRWLLMARRLIIISLMLLAFIYYRTIASAFELASLGLLSFSLVAQFAPAIVAAVYWRPANKRGVFAGLFIGIITWTYLLLIPSLCHAGYLANDWYSGPWFGFSQLAPSFWLDTSIFDSLTLGVFWSLLLNALTLIFVSLNTQATKDECVQALKFVSSKALSQTSDSAYNDNHVTLADLFELNERFIGKAENFDYINRHYDAQTIASAHTIVASVQDIETCQRRLSRVIGGSSAQIIMDTLTGKKSVPLRDVVDMVDEATQVFTFNRELLQSAMENISHGISVIDSNLKLVAWNRHYQQLFNYPDELLVVGRPIKDLIYFNATQGLFGDSDRQAAVEKRLNYLKQASAHSFERQHNGRVITVQGNPMPGGGFVTVFIDITELRQKQQQLAEVNASLEDRVNQRTEQLLASNRQLDLAKKSADAANLSKTRFLAAASHDILQPLNAASLLTQALSAKTPSGEMQQQLNLIQRSLNLADELLSDLLEISKLDAGVITVKRQCFALYPLLKDLCDEFAVIAEQKSIQLKPCFTSAVVESDPSLLRRILQNYISNAIRYSQHGKVLVGARVQQQQVKISVWDQGCGVARAMQSKIFEEFTRVDQHSSQTGHGLGLAIAARCANLLEHPLNVSSQLSQGSCFSVTTPLVERSFQDKVTAPVPPHDSAQFDHLTLLCVDNDQDILHSMRTLLEQWGATVTTCRSLAEVKRLKHLKTFDLLLVDHHLDNQETGFMVMDYVTEQNPCAVFLLTADRSERLRDKANERNIPMLYKPIKAMKLRALIKNTLL
ncbi:MAG: PAS-domain containing protein [Gammaproteobacteria bacterium]|nr:PAS-domain containing protein [Gammaproteobacteria bacterium]